LEETPDGAGGGGAGGCIFKHVTNSSTAITIQARGGNGGNTENDGV
jgi:hypothetical protein